MGSTEESAVEFKKQVGFMLMTGQFNVVLLQNLDFIVTKALGGASMKESSIFISFNRNPNFTSLFLVNQLFLNSTTKESNDDLAKNKFKAGEGPVFFNGVQKRNHKLAVCFPLRHRAPFPTPSL
jgi:hypothetical protein